MRRPLHSPRIASLCPHPERLVHIGSSAGFPPPCGEGQGGGVSVELVQPSAFTPTSISSPQGGGGLPALFLSNAQDGEGAR